MFISQGVHVKDLLSHVRSSVLWTCTDATALLPTPQCNDYKSDVQRLRDSHVSHVESSFTIFLNSFPNSDVTLVQSDTDNENNHNPAKNAVIFITAVK